MHMGQRLGSSVLAMAAAMLPCGAWAEDSAAEQDRSALIDTIIVTGHAESPLDIGGSVQLLTSEDLARFSYADVNRVLRQVPGVVLQEEDGFGLRPNIGIRGSGTDRSARVVIMEDGILKAPAAYSAPAAYYFPRLARIASIEVAKGPAAIKYGPSTIGGAINFFSTPIPDVPAGTVAGNVSLLLGSYESQRLHGWAGGWAALGGGMEIGALVEGLYEHSDGFKRIDIGGSTGFKIEDYTAKLGLRSAGGGHGIELKYQRNHERSDETYLGLSLADFAASPRRRYNASQRDEMTVRHETWQLTHTIELAPRFSLTTVAYRTDTARAWYKLNDVRNSANTGWSSLSDILADPEAFALQYADLVGAEGFAGRAGALRVRNNNRVYQTSGVQSVLSAGFDTGGIGHRLEVSARYHEDSEDRFQQDDRYQIADGRMVLTSAGAPGSQDNRVGDARAWAFFVRDTIEAGPVTIVPGLRYETIRLRQTRWAPGDAARDTPTSVVERNVDVFIPGISASYAVADDVRLVAGAHRGFTSPGPGSTTDVETSWNYEAGVKVARDGWHAEVIGFINDYENLVATCTASTGGDCEIGDQFDGNGVDVKGVEVLAGGTIGSIADGGFEVPLSVVYTYTDGHFKTAFLSGYEPWGAVEAGDELPYLADHQIVLNAGVATQRARFNASLNWVSETRATAGQGAIAPDDRVDDRVLVDLSAEFEILPGVAAFGTVQNLFDVTYNASFSPSGARPGAPRLAQAGVRARF